jgi:transcriptional regulator with XRE-family HTH domain
MTQWANPRDWVDGAVDLDIIEEAALAAAQSTIHNAITKSGISRSEMARRMGRNRSFITHMMKGAHNLTVKTLARSLAVCGYEVKFQPVALEWNWAAVPFHESEAEPACAGSSVFNLDLSTAEPAQASVGA